MVQLDNKPQCSISCNGVIQVRKRKPWQEPVANMLSVQTLNDPDLKASPADTSTTCSTGIRQVRSRRIQRCFWIKGTPSMLIEDSRRRNGPIIWPRLWPSESVSPYPSGGREHDVCSGGKTKRHGRRTYIRSRAAGVVISSAFGGLACLR